MVVYVGGLLALIVLLGALLSLVVPLPGWIPTLWDILLALAFLIGGAIYVRGRGVVA